MTNYENRSTILVTDPTGTVGDAVVERLGSSGQCIIRMAVDNNDQIDKLRHSHEIVKIDYTKPETIANALNNVDKLFLRIPPSVEMVDISSNFVKEAKKTSVKFIVKLSAMGADLEPGYTTGRLHRQVEKMIEESGMPFAFLRPNSFMQNFITRSSQTVKNQSKFFLPAGDSKVSLVDARDVAAVAVEVLIKNGNQSLNKAYDITGPEALTHSQVAKILSKETGRRIAYVDISKEDARKGMKKMGIGNWFIDNALELYNIYKSGYRSQTTALVEQFTEQKPISFSQITKNYVQNELGCQIS